VAADNCRFLGFLAAARDGARSGGQRRRSAIEDFSSISIPNRSVEAAARFVASRREFLYSLSLSLYYVLF
jgi:hypothetical protein